MTHLCLGGGSIRGICILGALHYLYMTNKITKITKLHACSIGSMIGILLILNKTPKEIFDYLITVDFRKYWDFDISKINTQFSILGQSIFNFYKEYMATLVDINITISELCHKYNTDINIITTCLNTRKTVIMNKDNFPNTKVIEAIIASSSIPFLFPPVKINDFYYVDGAVRNLCGCLDETIDNDTIVIKIGEGQYKPEDLKIDNFKDYAITILKSMITHTSTTNNNKYCLNIISPQKFIGKHNFNDLTNTDKTDLFLSGLRQSEKFFKNLQTQDERYIQSIKDSEITSDAGSSEDSENSKEETKDSENINHEAIE